MVTLALWKSIVCCEKYLRHCAHGKCVVIMLRESYYGNI